MIKIKTVLCAAVGTASHQHGLEACTVYGDRTVCSCRHSKSSACAVYSISGIMSKNDKGVLNLAAQS